MKQLLGRYLTLFLVALVGVMPIAHAAQQTINRGTTAGDGQGETLFSAFGKVNSNFTEIYTTYAPLASPTFTGTVSGITKGMVGLGNVDNTADANKPISTAVAAALPQFYGTKASFPASGVPNVLYVANDNGLVWRWTGSGYVSLGNGFGEKVLTVGAGGQYPTIQAAINAAGDRIKLWDTYTGNVIATNGSAVLALNTTGASVPLTKFYTSHPLIKIGAAATKFYKIKSWDKTSATLPFIELYEPFAEASISSVDTVRLYYIDPVTIVLLPGEHITTTAEGTTGTVMQPGINLLALDGASIAISENSSAPNYLFENIYENTFTRIHARATTVFGDMDSFGKASPNAWAGAELTFVECAIDHLNDGSHSGGIGNAPALKGGFTRFYRSVLKEAKNGWLLFAGRVTATNDNTVVEVFDSVVVPANDIDSKDTAINPMAFGIIDPGTFNFYNTRIVQPIDYANSGILLNDAPSDNWGQLYIGAASIVNWYGGAIDIKNTSLNNEIRTIGIETKAAATVNIHNTSIKAFGTQATGIYNDGATISLHNTYVEGAAASIRNISGTVNVEKGVTLNGPVIGAISSTVRGIVTLNGTTPVTVTTSKVHANSRIKLSRQTAAGTMGHFSIGTITDNTSFTIVGQASDTSVVMWELEH